LANALEVKLKNKKIDWTKVVACTDIHVGLKNNSREHNINCENFIKWFIEQARANNCKTGVFLGDFHHIRASINISTLNYSVSILRMLNDYFDDFFFLVGNHDLYYRDKFEIHSLPYIKEFPNIHAVEEITTIGDYTFVPWLVADEWKKVGKNKSPYMFGHFELPRFKMNAQVEMPDHGQLNTDHFANQQMVFSGHFHKRQNQNKIWYIGNCFPHNFSDAGDDDRGMMIWTPGSNPQFQAWPGAPKYRNLLLSDVLSDPMLYVDQHTYARITVDVDLTFEETNFIKELLTQELGAREITMVPTKIGEISFDDSAELNFESVDTIVISHIQSIDSNTIDNQELIDIYNRI